MSRWKVLDLFSGIGGFSLGLEHAGMQTVAFCEIEKFPQKVLRKHWPEVPIYEDVRELTAVRLAADGIKPNVICGGFPCQDISVAGKGAGLAGERSGLWREYARLIGEIRPEYVIVENVAALLGRGLSTVLGDLTEIGYDAEWHCIPAGNLGAPHERDRTWIVAYPIKTGLEGLRITSRIKEKIPVLGVEIAYSNSEKITSFVQFSELPDKLARSPIGLSWQGNEWPSGEPLICRMDDGIPDRVGRTGSCGNAVVPQIPEIIGRAIIDYEEGKR